MKRALIAMVLQLSIVGSAAARVAIEVSSISLSPGAVGTVDVTLRTDRTDVSGTGNRVGWNGPFSLGNCRVNPEIQRPATVFAYSPNGCERGGPGMTTCSSLRAIVFSLAIAPALSDGDVLYSCEAVPHSDALPGEYSLTCSEADSGSELGVPLDTDCVDGVLEIRAPPATPSATSTEPPFASSPTATPVTPTPVVCPGDCDGDGRVSIQDLVSAVRIALGEVDVTACAAATRDGNQTVSIAELVQAVRAALGGCG